LLPGLKVYEQFQNGAKEATFNKTACEDPKYDRRRAENLKISDNGVWYTLQWLKETGWVQDKKRPGRSRRTSTRQDKHWKLLSLHDRRKSSQQLTNEMSW